MTGAVPGAALQPPPVFPLLRRAWLLGTVGLSLAALVGAVLLAPPADASPGRALATLLFVGTSVHVASTAWFYTLPGVRAHARANRGPYVVPDRRSARLGVVMAHFVIDARLWRLRDRRFLTAAVPYLLRP